MTRTLLIAVKIAIVVLIAIWLADWKGQVAFDLPAYDLDLYFYTLSWSGYHVEMPIGILVLLAVILLAIVALLYRGWLGLRRAPKGIGRKVADGKRKRGYKALSNGMVAVAAGDAAEAQRWARRADSLLNDPPLTLLLSAQAAQLDGDENAAKRYFEAMLDNPDTRFLGLRGLVMQALKQGDDAQALTYLRQAKRLRPKTPWVLTNLFEVGERSGNLEEAEEALKIAARAGSLPAPESKSKRGLLQLKRALAAEEEGQAHEALRLAKAARKLAPGHLPANLAAARLALQAGGLRDAQKIVEDAWARTPHPDLARVYRDAQRGLQPVEYLKRLPKLTGRNANHLESHIALAEAALAAELWGEARRHLEAAGGDNPPVRVCRLMAQLEHSEHSDEVAARKWLERSLAAPADPVWLCNDCSARAADWSLHCPACDALDSLDWRQPKQAQLAAIDGEDTAPVIAQQSPETPQLSVEAEPTAEPERATG